MRSKVLIINGHPDPAPERFCAALCDAYALGAIRGGADLRRLDIGDLDFPLIRSSAAFEDQDPPPAIRAAQNSIRWADHIVVVHPLWLGAAPAVLKGFFEQTFRYGFAIPKPGSDGPLPMGRLRGKSAHVIVTMGMPAPIYRVVFGGFGIRGFERGVLRLSGIGPIKTTYYGEVEGDPRRRAAWLAEMIEFGVRGA